MHLLAKLKIQQLTRLNCFISLNLLQIPCILELCGAKKELLSSAQYPWIVGNIIVKSNFRRRNSKDSTCNISKRSGYVELLSVPIFLANLHWTDSILCTSQ